jgi:DNA-binding XRE family transcriptional regulator
VGSVENKLEETLKNQGRMKGWLAEKIGTNRNTITGLCKGQEPHLSLAYKIANALGKEVTEIWPNKKEPLD